jgi:predicted metal-dependent phosphoesterase TrpH
MPARQPFTTLCRSLARKSAMRRADLHVHTTHSDGEYTPAQVVDLAGRSGLAALALTDHDSLNGLSEARAAAQRFALEIISGVEITAEHQGREIHLLGYFIREDDPALTKALARLREHRLDRYWKIVEQLRHCGIHLDESAVRRQSEAGCLGRRHLAVLLVQTRQAGSIREAFARYLGEGGRAAVPKLRLPVAEAIALVRGAGGVAAWAHPTYDSVRDQLPALCDLGLGAIEVVSPNRRPAHARALRALAQEHGLAITGGSDYHGPAHARRALGCCSVSDEELAELRRRASA